MSEVPALAQLRRARGWSQAGLAERSGVSRTEISAIETGRLVPSVAVALRVAAALDRPVEDVFGGRGAGDPAWAWLPPLEDDLRVWGASVGGTPRWYPAEPTAAGVLPHDAWIDDRGHPHPRTTAAADRTLVVAGCDPLPALLARELAEQHGIRLLPLLRSSAAALELLGRGLVHAAGVHVTNSDGRPDNDRVVRSTLGVGYRLAHQVRWEAGVAVMKGRRERSPDALLRANLRWVNREEGSAARHAFDLLLASRRRPAGYEHVVRDHRAVAVTVASGWAEAGVCVRPAAAEADLAFVPLRQETYELCVRESELDSMAVRALLAVLQSATYRRLLADIPGCSVQRTGDVRCVDA